MGKINRKHERNKTFCTAYRNQQRAERAKARKLIAHLRETPWDDCARAAFERLPAAVKKSFELPKRTQSPTERRAHDGTTLTRELRAFA